MKEFKSITALISSYTDGKLDYQNAKTSNFVIVAKDKNNKKFYQSFTISDKKDKQNKYVSIAGTYFKKGKKVFI